MKFSFKGILSAVAGLAVSVVAGPIVGAALGVSGTLGSVVGGAITGAAGGAVTAAISKQPIAKGALMGAAGGALGGAASAAFGSATQTPVAGMSSVPQSTALARTNITAADIPSLTSGFASPTSTLTRPIGTTAQMGAASPAAMSAALPIADTMAAAGGPASGVAQAAVPLGTSLLDKYKSITSGLGFTGKDLFSGIMGATQPEPGVAQAEAQAKANYESARKLNEAKFQGLAEALQRSGNMGYRYWT